MEVALTPYGRYKLSRGRLNPTFYAFYDDDVIYDNQHANANPDSLPFVELQNDIEGRIQEDTPKLRVIRSRTSVEDEINDAAALREMNTPTGYTIGYIVDNFYTRAYSGEMTAEVLERVQPLKDQLYGLKYPLASADPYSSNYPAWDIEFLKAKMTGSAGDTESFTTYMRLTGTFSPPTDGTKAATESETREIQLELIPQLKARGQYQTYINFNEEDLESEIFLGPYSEEQIVVEEDFLLLKVEENNTEFLLKNFDMQLFAIEYEYDSSAEGSKKGKEILIPLDNSSFDISFDENIPNDIICAYINDQSQGVFSDMLVDCGDVVEEDTEIDIYSGLTDGNPGDVC